MTPARIIVCNTIQPFVTGGSEMFAERLTKELCRAGHQAVLVTYPFKLRKFNLECLVRACLPWQSLDLSRLADVVIALRFPTWLVQHRNKIVYLNHQLRAAYDVFNTSYGPAIKPDTLLARQYVFDCDIELGKSKKIFAVSRNVQQRLQHYNGLDSELLYHSLPLEGKYRKGPCGDYILSAGRLVSMKRFDLLIRALSFTRTSARCIIVGEGREYENLQQLIKELNLGSKVSLVGWVTAKKLTELFSGALGVFYAPVDEDYGLVSLEAFKSAKPVLTAVDSGGVLEFVTDGVNGRVLSPEPEAFAVAIDQLFQDRLLAVSLGSAGAKTVRGITWKRCIRRLEEFF